MEKQYFYPLLLSLCLLGACHRPSALQTQVPFAMEDSFSATGSDPLPDKWWHSFDDPNLNSVIEQGLAGSFGVRVAWDRLRQAEQTAVIFGANLYPQVDYSASATRTYRDNDAGSRSYSTYVFGAGASYEVDLWDRVGSLHKAALLDAEAAYDDVTTAAVTLSAAIAQSWYRLAEARLQEQLVAGQLETNRQMLLIIQYQFRQGQVGAANVFRQEQLVEATQGQMILIQDDIALLQNELSVLIGRQPGQWWADKQLQLITLPELPAVGLPSELLLRRPDLRSSRKAIEAADFRVAAAVAEQYPRLDLFVLPDTSASKIRDLFQDWSVDLAADLSGPIFDAGFRKANAERTRAVLSEAVNRYGQDVLTAFREVEDALQQESYQRKYLDSLRQQLTLAQRTYERTRQSYLKGQLDYIRVLESLVSTQTLERQELSARRQLIEYRIELCRALAGGWQMSVPPREPLDAADSSTQDNSENGTEQTF